MYSRERGPGVRQGKSWIVEVPRKMSVEVTEDSDRQGRARVAEVRASEQPETSTQDGHTPEELGGRGGSWGGAGWAGFERSPTHRPGSQEGGWGLRSCPGEGALRRGQSRVEGAGTVWKASLASRGSSWTWQGEEERGRLCRAGEAGEDRAAPMRAGDRVFRAGRTPSPMHWPFAMGG